MVIGDAQVVFDQLGDALEAGMLSDLNITFHGLSQIENKDTEFTTGDPLTSNALKGIRQLTGLPAGRAEARVIKSVHTLFWSLS